MSNLLPLFRQTWRALLRAPGYWLATSLTLAVGLAAALGAFAPAWDVLAFPFSFREPGRIVSLSGEGRDRAEFLRPLSAPDFWDLRRELKHVECLGACRDAWPEVEFADGPRGVRTALTSPGFLQVLGLPLLLGRDFEAREAEAGGAKVLILEHGFWLRRFGGDPRVLGQTLILDGAPHQIVGVLAPQRRLPFFMDDAIAFQPLAFSGGDRTREVASCWVYGRLAKGSTLAQLRAEVDRLVPGLGPSRSGGGLDWGIRTRSLVAYWRGRAAPGFLLSMACGLLILLLACANVAHLMLARNLDRTREWGLRAAFGAGSSGLRAPLLMEAALLTAGGGLLSWPLLELLRRSGVLPAEGFQGPVLVPMALTLVVALGATSLLPLRWAARLDLNAALKEGGAASVSKGSNRLRGMLAAFQLALAFALLVGAGLSFRALERLQHLDPGFDLRRLHVATLRLKMRPNEAFRDRSSAFQRQVREALAPMPGIEAMAMSNTRPLVDQGNGYDLWPEGGGAVRADQHGVSPEYFKTLGLPILAGRGLEEGEPGACLVSASLARRCWGNDPPLGRRIRLFGKDGPLLSVVGVVGEARMSRLAREAVPAVYTPLAGEGSAYFTVYLRSGAPPAALRAMVLRAAAQADPACRLMEFQNLEAVVSNEFEGPRALRKQALAAGILAAFLAGIGLAGTLAQAAARQRREWGIRAALGARPAGLFLLVVRRVLSLLAAGLAMGALLAWVLSRLLQQQFQSVNPADPGFLAFAVVSLGLTGLCAGLGTALRAARVDPAKALRSE